MVIGPDVFKRKGGGGGVKMGLFLLLSGKVANLRHCFCKMCVVYIPSPDAHCIICALMILLFFLHLPTCNVKNNLFFSQFGLATVLCRLTLWVFERVINHYLAFLIL